MIFLKKTIPFYNLRLLFICFGLFLLTNCNDKTQLEIDVQGHRGCRGLYPENSIPAFVHALNMGVSTLELDVVISKDKKVIVSHEPFFAHTICLNADGSPIEFEKEKSAQNNIYKLSKSEIKKRDCGIIGNSSFPDQTKVSTYKPSLEEVIDTIEQLLKISGAHPVKYNIEIKRKKKWDGIYSPKLEEYTDLVLDFLQAKNILDRCILQSFDLNTLQYINKKHPKIMLALLVQNHKSPSENIQKLGFIPDIYSPYFKLVTSSTIKWAETNKTKLIPWTVNSQKDIKRLLKLGVEGIITDYPNRLIQVINEQKKFIKYF